MMKRKLTYLVTVLCFALSCQEQDSPVAAPEGPKNSPISFYIASSETKSEATTENLDKIFLYGIENSTPIYDNTQVLRPKSGSVWIPEPVIQWNYRSSYMFYAFSYKKKEGQNIADVGELTVKDKGTTIHVVQPSNYILANDGTDNTIDYLLSHKVLYSPSAAQPLVPIYLEHTLSKISILIEKRASMKSTDITELQIELKNIKTTADMQCIFHKEYDKPEQLSHVWSHNLDNMAQTTYVFPVEKMITQIPDIGKSTAPLINFIAIPVDKTGMKDYILWVKYKVKGVSEPYIMEFSLCDYPYEWKSGHNTRYRLKLDNGIYLDGSIHDWIKVDYIEGTILPPTYEPVKQIKK